MSPCPGGVTGSRGGLKIRYRKVCGFDPRPGHDQFASVAERMRQRLSPGGQSE